MKSVDRIRFARDGARIGRRVAPHTRSAGSSEPAPASPVREEREKAIAVPSVHRPLRPAPPAAVRPLSGGRSLASPLCRLHSVVAGAAEARSRCTDGGCVCADVLGLNSLRGRFVFMTAATIAGAIGITGYVAFEQGSASLVNGLRQNFQSMAVATMDKIDRGMMERCADVQAFAADPVVVAALSGRESPDRFTPYRQ